MSLKPIDITNKQFNSKFKGYDRNEVDDFLDQLALDYEKILQQNRELEKDIKQAQEKLSYFDDLKDSLNQSIIVAQDTADKLKENATKESDLAIQQAQAQSEDILAHASKMSEELITAATAKANKILNDSSERARQLAVETDDLKKKTRVFHRNLSVLLESQLQIVQSDEWDELLKPFGAYVDNTHQAFKEVLDAVEAANAGGTTSNAVAVDVQPNFNTEAVAVETDENEVTEETRELPKNLNNDGRSKRNRLS
ncbi:DivIVA domain-containing protein [Vagococcus silagei]|uniref:DivIVA domain-containing protein n=1 Tax=Vagococcus silagei TaxID=2508885 RepID=A0A4S3B175_9ENTE|nr:DivIVA domain-containing protein [Vagococcus silagei]THB60844.1 DivIVA domain-containing protein [Vagococcus silagei]